uniref:Peptidase A2 domain-containing protein n=1 Tax=Cyanothece sp. (strain PCC 7425 / ATCC 29141) TaxID=395961 RepID=B8HSQ4_CYAP4
MLNSQRFSFVEHTNSAGLSSVMPYLPITLSYRDRSLELMALLDTGASVNVLPYDVCFYRADLAFELRLRGK